MVSNLPGIARGIPSHDTFGDVFARLDPTQFQNCFVSWTQAIAQLLPGEVVAIDGKTARRSYDRARSKGGMHMVSAWATQNTLTLGQVKTEAKSNEITAIPQLLDLLDLHDCVVTIDAMGCQREIAQQITAGGANCVLAVKENQGQLHEGIRDLFAVAEALGFDGVPYDYSQTVNKGHGRVERCPASTIFAGWRQSVLPVHLLGLDALLGSVGPVAGDVKLQDDGVVHDPVNRRGGGHGVGEDALPLGEDQV